MFPAAGPREPRARRCLVLTFAALGIGACGQGVRVPPAADPALRPPVADYPALERAPVPATLDEALDTLQRELPRDAIEALYASETDVTIELHETLGRWMRDRWGLWTGGPLADHLRALGLDHPDDMSGVILTSLWRRLHFQPLRVEAQVHWYQAFRRAVEAPDPRSNPACAGRVDIAGWWSPASSIGVSAVDAATSRTSVPTTHPGGTLRIVHLGACSSDGRLWAWEAERGWFEPEPVHREYWDREISEIEKSRGREEVHDDLPVNHLPGTP
jgi:hypothetical protein